MRTDPVQQSFNLIFFAPFKFQGLEVELLGDSVDAVFAWAQALQCFKLESQQEHYSLGTLVVRRTSPFYCSACVCA